MVEAWRFDEVVGRINDRAERLGKLLQDDVRDPRQWLQLGNPALLPAPTAELTEARAALEDKIRAGLAKAGQKVKKKR